MWRDEALLLDMLLADDNAREFAAGLDWRPQRTRKATFSSH
jgi:hypothetical protein